MNSIYRELLQDMKDGALGPRDIILVLIDETGAVIDWYRTDVEDALAPDVFDDPGEREQKRVLLEQYKKDAPDLVRMTVQGVLDYIDEQSGRGVTGLL